MSNELIIQNDLEAVRFARKFRSHVRKHTALDYMTEISSTLRIIVNSEFNSYRVLKMSNINFKVHHHH